MFVEKVMIVFFVCFSFIYLFIHFIFIFLFKVMWDLKTYSKEYLLVLRPSRPVNKYLIVILKPRDLVGHVFTTFYHKKLI